MRRAPVALLLLLLVPQRALAWPAETMAALSRDARKLLPRSLSRLLGERESFVLDETRRFPPELARALAQDLPTGRLRPQTLQALSAHSDAVFRLLKEGQVTEGLVRLGGLLRIPADLSDPVLSVGPEGWPPGLTREYYGLFDGQSRQDAGGARRPRGAQAHATGAAGALAVARRPQPRAGAGDARRAVRERPGRRPSAARLPLAGLGGLLARLLAGRHRHRRHLARGVARGERRHHPHARGARGRAAEPHPEAP